jgi:hypothetical protein
MEDADEIAVEMKAMNGEVLVEAATEVKTLGEDNARQVIAERMMTWTKNRTLSRRDLMEGAVNAAYMKRNVSAKGIRLMKLQITMSHMMVVITIKLVIMKNLKVVMTKVIILQREEVVAGEVFEEEDEGDEASIEVYLINLYQGMKLVPLIRTKVWMTLQQ